MTGIFEMSASGAALIIAVVMIRQLGGGKLPRAVFPAMWYVTIARLLLPVSLPAWIPVRLPIQLPVQDFVGSMPDSGLGGAADPLPSVAASDVKEFPVAVLIYAVGAILVAGYFAVMWVRCRVRFSAALPQNAGDAVLWLAEHPLRRRVRVRVLPGLLTPLTYGIFRPVILLPEGIEAAGEGALRYVMSHEQAHIRRFDAAGKLLSVMALCVHWFNPLVWVMYVLFGKDIELACDEEVLHRAGGDARKAYANALLSMEAARTEAAAASYFNKNNIEERIITIMRYRKKPLIAAVAAVVLVLLSAALVFAVTGIYQDEDTPLWGEGMPRLSELSDEECVRIMGELGVNTEYMIERDGEKEVGRYTKNYVTTIEGDLNHKPNEDIYFQVSSTHWIDPYADAYYEDVREAVIKYYGITDPGIRPREGKTLDEVIKEKKWSASVSLDEALSFDK